MNSKNYEANDYMPNLKVVNHLTLGYISRNKVMKETLHTLKIHNISQDSLDIRRAISHSTREKSDRVEGDEENS